METLKALHIFIALTLSEKLLPTMLTYPKHSDAEGAGSWMETSDHIYIYYQNVAAIAFFSNQYQLILIQSWKFTFSHKNNVKCVKWQLLLSGCTGLRMAAEVIVTNRSGVSFQTRQLVHRQQPVAEYKHQERSVVRESRAKRWEGETMLKVSTMQQETRKGVKREKVSSTFYSRCTLG